MPARRTRPPPVGTTRSQANNIPGKPGVLNPGESGATNLGPRSKTLKENTQELVAYWKARGVNPTPDLVTTSGSGYDPDISQQDALVQIPMVSRATGLSAVGAPAPRHQPDARGRARFLGHLVHRRAPAQRGSGQTEVSSTAISAVVAAAPERGGREGRCRSSPTSAPGSAPTSSSATATGVIVLRFMGRAGCPGSRRDVEWSSTALRRSTGRAVMLNPRLHRSRLTGESPPRAGTRCRAPS